MPQPKRDFSGASHSSTLSEGLERALAFLSSSSPCSSVSENRSFSPAAPESPSELLKRALSVESVVSTKSSFAERMNRARNRPVEDKPDYRIIGLGSCGTVFEVPGTQLAVKKGPDTKAMRNDFLLTNRVYNAIADTRDFLQDAFPERTIPKSPQCPDFMLSSSKDYWDANRDKFPKSHRETGAAFQVDRILPLSQPIREALIKVYFEDSDEIQEEAKNDVDNKDCLVRIYLGENETPKQESECYDSLRNFPLRLNMIEDLDLDKIVLATEMAIALAVIHWEAQVDAMDAEFVLGSAAETPSERRRPYAADKQFVELPPPSEVHTFQFNERSIHLWVLDFDKATPIELTANDVDKKLVPAFLGNDPYYPRPDVDEELWVEFSRIYLMASELILENRKKKDPVITSLPNRFLTKVAEMIEENEAWDPDEQIVFGN
ncbi:hypothetical protein MMC07_000099 [Pseudocyphellaria aurata]|nr:hypothetical protein [Pseudocyphellaria aurata]